VIEQDDSKAYNDFRELITGKMCREIDHIKDINIQVPKAITALSQERNLQGWVRASSMSTILSQQSALPPKIEMFTDSSERYHVNEMQSGHMLSTVKIGVTNVGGKTLSNCKVYVDQITPPPDIPAAGTAKMLETGVFQLRRDDPERLVDIAAHWDHIDKFRFSAPFPGGAWGDPFDLNDIGKRTFAVRVKATECERAAMFEIATDDTKRLHLTFLHYID
jgi:hypothetical protein